MSIQASSYKIFELRGEGKETLHIQESIVSFTYYESIFLPYVSGELILADSGASVKYSPEIDRQERLGSLFNAYGIKGGERINFYITNPSGQLDYTSLNMEVKKSSNIKKESNREILHLDLVSDFYTKDKNSIVPESFKDIKYSDAVKNILKQNSIDFEESNIEDSSNSADYIGNSKKISDVMVDLAKKAKPGKGSPGFLFYQNQQGHNFRSIDTLINQPPINTTPYFQSEVLRSGLADGHNDYKIAKFDMIRNQDIESLFNSGSLSSKINVWDPKTQIFSEKISYFDELNLKKMGSVNLVPDLAFSNEFSKTYESIIDYGTFSPLVASKPNHAEKYLESDSQTRYNILLSRIAKIQVPCNLCLKVGDIVRFDFEPITQDSKVQGVDPNQSGNYLIIDLSHYFDQTQSYTTMMVVRDSFGLHSSKD